VVIVLMGAAGAGKTTIGRALGGQLGWPFVDADALQPPDNVELMRRGVPLTDQHRAAWLAAVHGVIARAIDRREHTVVACSALKVRYRALLRDDLKRVRFVHLTADPVLLRERLEQRTGHFAGVALLASQLADLEPPDPLTSVVIDAALDPSAIVCSIRREFGV
jgi:gluconokinase